MISDEEKRDLERLSKEYNLDFQELLDAYKETSSKFDDYKKTDKEEEEKDLKDIEKKIDEVVKRITKLKSDDDGLEDIDNQVEILEQIERCKQEGLIPSDSTEKED